MDDTIHIGVRVPLSQSMRVATALNWYTDEIVNTIVMDRIRSCGGMAALIASATNVLKRPNATVAIHVVFDELPVQASIDLWL